MSEDFDSISTVTLTHPERQFFQYTNNTQTYTQASVELGPYETLKCGIYFWDVPLMSARHAHSAYTDDIVYLREADVKFVADTLSLPLEAGTDVINGSIIIQWRGGFAPIIIRQGGCITGFPVYSIPTIISIFREAHDLMMSEERN